MEQNYKLSTTNKVVIYNSIIRQVFSMEFIFTTMLLSPISSAFTHFEINCNKIKRKPLCTFLNRNLHMDLPMPKLEMKPKGCRAKTKLDFSNT